MSITTRTTIAIDSGLLQTAKAAARRQGCTLGQYISQALQHTILDDATPRPAPAPVALPVAGGGVPNPGIDWSSNASIMDVLDAADLAEGRLPRW
ncbi:MAG: hypothetical protein FWC46_02800 [Actinomycetia bacterium]|nr:hypothetical protein [Actinomycetes bacterium]